VNRTVGAKMADHRRELMSGYESVRRLHEELGDTMSPRLDRHAEVLARRTLEPDTNNLSPPVRWVPESLFIRVDPGFDLSDRPVPIGGPARTEGTRPAGHRAGRRSRAVRRSGNEEARTEARSGPVGPDGDPDRSAPVTRPGGSRGPGPGARRLPVALVRGRTGDRRPGLRRSASGRRAALRRLVRRRDGPSARDRHRRG
jgi:hypothetical protein